MLTRLPQQLDTHKGRLFARRFQLLFLVVAFSYRFLLLFPVVISSRYY